MTRRAALFLVLAIAACGIDDFDPEGRTCPCIRGWVCNETVNECVEAIERDFTPTVIGEEADLHHGRGELVVPEGEHWLFHTGNGTVSIHDDDTFVDEPREVLREGTGVDGDIGFVVIDTHALGVFSFSSLRVSEGASVVLVGSNAGALLAADTIVVEGLLSAGAERVGSLPGPGGGMGAPYSTSTTPEPGASPLDVGGGGTARGAGSGASYGGCGGVGGAVPASAPGRAAAPWAAMLDGRFVGGAGGGAGGAGSNNACSGHSYPGQRGGHGGGALALIANVAIFVGPSGVVDARGGGGSGGKLPAAGTMQLFDLTAGSGGGSGGAILIESPLVDVAGAITASGGAGGGGAGMLDANGDMVAEDIAAGEDGEHGTDTAEPARGGEGAHAGGHGGVGSDASGCAGDGGLGTATPGEVGRTGGGGGGSGVLYLLAATRNVRDTALLRPSIASTLVGLGELGGGLPALSDPACECPSTEMTVTLGECI